MKFKAPATALAILGLHASGAAAYSLEDIDPFKHVGITDSSTTQYVQPRYFAVGVNQTLYTKEHSGSWTNLGITDVLSSVGATSWVDGTTIRQRVYYRQGSGIQALVFDNNVRGAAQQITLSGAVIGGDLDAILWNNNGVLTEVLAGQSYTTATGQGQTYRVCTWFRPAGTTNWTAGCSASQLTYGGRNGLTVNSTGPRVFFKTLNSLLGSYQYSSATSSVYQQIALPSGVTVNELFVERDFVGIRSGTGDIWVADVPVNVTAPTWVNLGKPASTSPVQDIHGMAYSLATSNGDRRVVWASTADKLYVRLRLGNGSWGSWSGARSPGTGEQVHRLHGVLSGAGGTAPALYLTGGSTGNTSYLMQFSANDDGSGAFQDHVRPRTSSALITGLANEGTVAFGHHGGIAVALQRNNPVPWGVQLSTTISGGHDWTAPVSVQPVPANMTGRIRSITDPTSAVTPGGSTLHYADWEPQHTIKVENGEQKCESVHDGVVSYRRGTSGSAMAAAIPNAGGANGSWIVAQGSLDHPWMVTSGPWGTTNPAVKIAWLNTTESTNWQVRYASKLDDATQFNYKNLNQLKNPPVIAQGGAGNDATYIWSASWLEPGWPTLCAPTADIGNGYDLPVNCWGPPSTLSPVPRGSHPIQLGTDTAISNQIGVGQPVSIAVDYLSTPPGIYVAYHAADPGLSTFGPDDNRTDDDFVRYSVYYTRYRNGAWSTPVRVHARTGTRDYFDPEISVDMSGYVFITYNEIDRAAGDVVRVKAGHVQREVSETAANWTTSATLSTWYGLGLPKHCGRSQQRFLGEYRTATVMGGKAYHMVLTSTSVTDKTTSYRGMWLSKQLMN